MPRLKLHRETPDPDVIPFPRAREEWSPRLAGSMDSIRNVEKALEAVESRFAQVRALLDETDGDDDRPRAA